MSKSRPWLIAVSLILLTIIGCILAVQKAALEKRLNACSVTYEAERKKDKSWDCNPEIRMLTEELHIAEKERDKYKYGYLKLLVEKQQRIK